MNMLRVFKIFCLWSRCFTEMAIFVLKMIPLVIWCKGYNSVPPTPPHTHTQRITENICAGVSHNSLGPFPSFYVTFFLIILWIFSSLEDFSLPEVKDGSCSFRHQCITQCLTYNVGNNNHCWMNQCVGFTSNFLGFSQCDKELFPHTEASEG